MVDSITTWFVPRWHSIGCGNQGNRFVQPSCAKQEKKNRKREKDRWPVCQHQARMASVGHNLIYCIKKGCYSEGHYLNGNSCKNIFILTTFACHIKSAFFFFLSERSIITLHTHQTVGGALVATLSHNWPELSQTSRYSHQLLLDLQSTWQPRRNKNTERISRAAKPQPHQLLEITLNCQIIRHINLKMFLIPSYFNLFDPYFFWAC